MADGRKSRYTGGLPAFEGMEVVPVEWAILKAEKDGMVPARQLQLF